MNWNQLPGFIAMLMGLGLAAPLACAGENPPGGQLLQDFSSPPAYSFLSWEGKPKAVDGALLVQVPDDRGGCGYMLIPPLDFSQAADRTPVLTVTVGAANKLAALGVFIKDRDETTHAYVFNLAGVAAGATATITANDGASLKEPSNVSDPGKQAGFDLAQVGQVGIVGRWSGMPVDLIVRRLELVEPTPEILTARAKLRERLAKEAEQRRKAAEAAEKRKHELLAGGAPHPADGPEVRLVGTVAPDILALRIQEKEFVPVPQVPYEPREGDVVKREGKEDAKVLVVEDGKVRQSLLGVSVYRKEGNREIKLGSLAVNAKCIKPDDKSTGQDLITDTVGEAKAYRIVGIDDPDWRDPVAPAQAWWKRKPNAKGSVAFEVQIFLKLPKSLKEGKRYRIEFPGVNLRHASVEYLHEPPKTRSMAVHVSAIGFRPDDPFKRAFLSEWLGTGGSLSYAKDLKFHLLDDATGKSVFDGTAQMLKTAADKETFKAGRNYAKTDVLGMDFGTFKTPGRYRVYVEGIGCSYPFDLADDVWTKAFQLSMKGLLHHRSGIELGPPLTDYKRPRNMHPADGVKVFASDGTEAEGGWFKMLMERRTDRLLSEAWGGHMDAGDWDRNSAHPAAMWILVDLYELFPERIGGIKLALPESEAKNAIPDILDEVLWNLDLYRRLQTAEGGIRGGIESTAHPRPGEASWQESLMLSAYAPDPKASFIYAATAAKLARALATSDKELAETYAASARKAWDWAVDNQEAFLGKLDEKKRQAMVEELCSPRNLAAFELWQLTSEAAFHDKFKASFILAGAPGDVNTQSKAITSYARLPKGQGDVALRQTARQWVIKTADTGLAFADGNAFGLTLWVPTLPPMGWVGYFSTPETALGGVLPHAWLLTHDPKYLAGALRATQFGAGANPDNRAYTTGLGPDPVRFPLHVDCGVSGQPAPAGITVYGGSDPVEDFGDAWVHTWYLQKMHPSSRTWPAYEGSYYDIHVSPPTNEYTIHQTIIPTAFYWGFLAARR